VRSIYAAWERGDFTSLAWADPEIEHEYADGPSPGSWKGFDGMAEAFRESAPSRKHLRSERIRPPSPTTGRVGDFSRGAS
jgi:hypothetical protein